MRWLVGFLCLVLVACGGGDGDDSDSSENLSDAEDRIVAAVETIYKNQAGRTFDEYLVPGQREQIDREHFITCNTETAGVDAEIEVEESYSEMTDVPTIGDVETAAVTYQLSANDQTITNTSHAVEVDGEWYVFYNQERFDAYVAGDCP